MELSESHMKWNFQEKVIELKGGFQQAMFDYWRVLTGRWDDLGFDVSLNRLGKSCVEGHFHLLTAYLWH